MLRAIGPLGSTDHSGSNREHEVPDALWAVLGQGTQWCGLEQASSAMRAGVPQKKVGVWLRVRDDCADEGLIDGAALREIRMEERSSVIPGVEGGHLGPIGVVALDQIVVIAALRLAA